MRMNHKSRSSSISPRSRLFLQQMMTMMILFFATIVSAFTTTKKTSTMMIPSRPTNENVLCSSIGGRGCRNFVSFSWTFPTISTSTSSRTYPTTPMKRGGSFVLLSSSTTSITASSSSSSSSTDVTTVPSSTTTNTEYRSTKNRNTNNIFQKIQRRQRPPFVTRTLMILYIVGMCFALPITLLPTMVLYKLNLLSCIQKERIALATGRFCARWLLRLIPFVNIQCIVDDQVDDKNDNSPVPSIWVCNHTSMLDVFMLLASDRKLRGSTKRPIKVVYWKTLENNPITKLLFTQSGFIPVEMDANAPGEQNQYNKRSFKQLLTNCKQAFVDGFDVAVLPEGQLNPTPEDGVLPIFTGAYTLAKMSQRPISVMALYNIQNVWHPTRGMIGMDHNIAIRNYSTTLGTTGNGYYQSADEFKVMFEAIVGYFGQYGVDHPNLSSWYQRPQPQSAKPSSTSSNINQQQ